jgi:hypothetical protein
VSPLFQINAISLNIFFIGGPAGRLISFHNLLRDYPPGYL